MKNSTHLKNVFFKTLLLFICFYSTQAQVCGTPGADGPVAISNSINTYYPVGGNITLNAGAQSIVLGAVPPTDIYNNSFGSNQISTGDLILIIQMQDAEINYSNSTSYGSGTATSSPDNLGGTGFTSLGNTGVFEYVIAVNSVPLTGGNFTFKGTGTGGGVLNSFYNAAATTTRGKRTFQIVRVPQYSNLTLTSNITTPPFNGSTGGVIAFNVSGTFNFAGFKIDGTARGFRGGYSPQAASNANNSTTYVGNASNTAISGKGEGMAGTPRYMWDGYNQVDNGVEGMPGGSSGRGAPANAGGGGNDHNAGGGGGGNGGYGGLGGLGWQGGGGSLSPLTGGGRPGFRSYLTTTPFPRIIMGGGGGAGDANNASTGVKGGVGGAIILINAGTVQGSGSILANGGKGAPGAFSGSPDGAGGGGAGGTVLLNIANNSTATIAIEAKGGDGGNTENDSGAVLPHGPGGGGGGGIISHNLSGTVTINANVTKGLAGKSNAGNGNSHGAIDGTDGYVSTFVTSDIPPNLQINSNCFPSLDTKVKSLSTTAICSSIDETVSYEIEIKNTGSGNAADVVLNFLFPSGIGFDSATATYSIEASGPTGALTNTNTANNPVFGSFNIAKNGVVTITLVGKITGTLAAGTYNSSAQALYLDPTRTTANSNRKITAFTNAYGGANTKYEGASQANVPGTNFDGSISTVDNVTIVSLPGTPTTTVTQPTCTTSTGTIMVAAPANGSGISYTLKGTSPVTASISNAIGNFSNLVAGTYEVTTTNANGCTSLATTKTINTVAGAPTTTGVSICIGESGSLTASDACGSAAQNALTASGTGGKSNDVTYGGLGNTNILVNFPTLPNGALVTSTVTTITFESNGNSWRNELMVRVTPPITVGVMQSNLQPSMLGSKGTVTNASFGTWGTGNPSGNWLFEFRETFDDGPNPDADISDITITVNYTFPGSIEWYSVASNGSVLGTGLSFNPVGVAGSGLSNTNSAGTTTYYAACAGSTCRTATNFVIIAKPTITGTSPASRCDAGAVTLGAATSSGTINWYDVASGGSSLATGTSFTMPSLSATKIYYVDATDNGCTTTSRTAVTATVNTSPTITSTTEASRCSTGTLTLIASASSGTINWYADPVGGSSLATGASFTTPSLSASTTYYVGATTTAGCSSVSRIAVAAVVNTASTIALTSGTQNPTVCTGTAITTTVYTFGGSATNATVTNLPAGLASAVNTTAKTVTISGIPTVNGVYTITTVGHTSPCTAAT
ncbi:beta strand repeat-containing protein, partial [Flavobacterium sinopsychrotolerans]